ncbi:(2Fe-2S) ferredoxin domain-containing protein [Kamptonema animale CS-326]|jgi:(2Fe-2S) ferredoxin|uniref:(2Fe-2S) ferredoxin domain-containing protein n=1 Tax=Kamptonema TaxID=1501433 RepID=UPI00232F1402|nr:MULTISPECIES: (2Fe-2S) ferredoxin domain-containing protein [Kamptonema]MDB9511555.1 (2Fe-2S) ferredoxin domain-containing protein [Kamptonema animale CS-326]MDF0552551.1 (2Fe-2S) ferredoxin domain-containing protein [Kamptonema sp. UHCC 0994]
MPEIEGDRTNSDPQPPCILVCQYQSCLRNGAAEVLAAFEAAELPGIAVKASDCQGQCSVGPTVRITPEEIWYCRVKPSDVPPIVEQHIKGGKPVKSLLNPRIHIHFYY